MSNNPGKDYSIVRTIGTALNELFADAKTNFMAVQGVQDAHILRFREITTVTSDDELVDFMGQYLNLCITCASNGVLCLYLGDTAYDHILKSKSLHSTMDMKDPKFTIESLHDVITDALYALAEFK